MELTLTRQAGTQVAVTCDGKSSHNFDLLSLIPDEKIPNRPPQPLENPLAYGEAVFRALFPADTLAAQALAHRPERLLLVTTEPEVQMVPWEYAYGPDGFVVLNTPFVRGILPDKRIDPPPNLGGLHIVAVPSNPLSKELEALNIEGEWQRLCEVVGDVPAALTL